MSLSDGRNSFALRENRDLPLDYSRKKGVPKGRGEADGFPKGRHPSPALTPRSGNSSPFDKTSLILSDEHQVLKC